MTHAHKGSRPWAAATREAQGEPTVPSSSPGETIDCLYTVAETAGLLRLSESKVWQLIHKGKLDSLKIGWSRRVPASAIEQFIRDGVAAEQAAGGAVA